MEASRYYLIKFHDYTHLSGWDHTHTDFWILHYVEFRLITTAFLIAWASIKRPSTPRNVRARHEWLLSEPSAYRLNPHMCGCTLGSTFFVLEETAIIIIFFPQLETQKQAHCSPSCLTPEVDSAAASGKSASELRKVVIKRRNEALTNKERKMDFFWLLLDMSVPSSCGENTAQV